MPYEIFDGYVLLNGAKAYAEDRLVYDRGMFLTCGTKVAMDNAIDEIKRMEDYICDTNDNEGVAKWLEDYFKLEG